MTQQWFIGKILLKPERDYEGFNLPINPSSFGTSFGMVNEVRDPFVFKSGDDKYLFYSTAGESGIAVATI